MIPRMFNSMTDPFDKAGLALAIVFCVMMNVVWIISLAFTAFGYDAVGGILIGAIFGIPMYIALSVGAAQWSKNQEDDE